MRLETLEIRSGKKLRRNNPLVYKSGRRDYSYCYRVIEFININNYGCPVIKHGGIARAISKDFLDDNWVEVS